MTLPKNSFDAKHIDIYKGQGFIMKKPKVKVIFQMWNICMIFILDAMHCLWNGSPGIHVSEMWRSPVKVVSMFIFYWCQPLGHVLLVSRSTVRAVFNLHILLRFARDRCHSFKNARICLLHLNIMTIMSH